MCVTKPLLKMWKDKKRKCYSDKYKNKNSEKKEAVENKMKLHIKVNVLPVCLRMQLRYNVKISF